MAKKSAKKADQSAPISPEITPDLPYIDERLRPLAVAIVELILDPKNARQHDERNLSAIAASLRQYGIRKNVVVQIAGDRKIVRAGNGTVLAAIANGWTHVPAIFCAEDDQSATGYAIADNRTAELSEWNDEMLREALAELSTDGIDDELNLMFSDLDAEIKAAIEGVENAPAGRSGAGGRPAPEIIEDEIPKPPKKVITNPGDFWILGAHRLLCGDSTRSEDVARVMGTERAGLMNTDPPYGVEYKNDDRPGVSVSRPLIANDEKQGDELQEFLQSVFHCSAKHALMTNAAWYIWHACLTEGYFSAAAAAAAAANVVLHRQIIWVKANLLLGRGQYHWKHEPCFMGWVKGNQPPDYGLGNGERTQTTIWELKSISHVERREFDHATPKPVELFAIPIMKHLKPGEICFEPFAGTGPQFIAAEQLNCRCFGLEIEPKYCDVIVARWEKLTGKKAERVAAGAEIPAAA